MTIGLIISDMTIEILLKMKFGHALMSYQPTKTLLILIGWVGILIAISLPN